MQAGTEGFTDHIIMILRIPYRGLFYSDVGKHSKLQGQV